MRENENISRSDISDLFKQRVLSGEQYGSIYFWEDLAKIEKEGISGLSIRINASELPAGRESSLCDFLKAFIEKGGSKQVFISGTKEQRDYLIKQGCANALNSGIRYEIIG